MKMTKKAAAVFLCLCMAAFPAGNVRAAGPQLRFTDPQTTVGATFEITAKLTSDAGIGEASAALTYDTNFLKFVSGEGAQGGEGGIQLTGAGNGAAELSWNLKFQALAEGTGKVEIADVNAKSAGGAPLQVTRGNSTVAIDRKSVV